MTQYEYKVLSGRPDKYIEKELNELVSAGWEVASSHTSSDGFLIICVGSLYTVTTFVLRKALAS